MVGVVYVPSTSIIIIPSLELPGHYCVKVTQADALLSEGPPRSRTQMMGK